MKAATFDACKCGFPKAAHTEGGHPPPNAVGEIAHRWAEKAKAAEAARVALDEAAAVETKQANDAEAAAATPRARSLTQSRSG